MSIQWCVGLQQFGLQTGAGLEPSLTQIETLPWQVDLAGLERRAEDLGPGLCVEVLAADTLAVLTAGDLGLVTLAVVLQTAGPLAVAALVVSEREI